jgi:hypothetical protein
MTTVQSIDPVRSGVTDDWSEPTSSEAKRPNLFLGGATLVIMAVGMAFSLWWPTLVRHHSSYWAVPNDIWSAVRAAHFVQWGGLSYVYSYHSALLTLPGFEIILAPVAALCSALGLSESSITLFLVKPQAWLLIGPFCLATAGVAVFALDALARQFKIARGTRRLLTASVVVAIWPTIAYWGHPEDVIGLGLAIYALLAVSNRRPTLGAWLFGAAIAMQLYLVLLVPIFLGVMGIRKGVPFLARAALLPGFLLVAVLVPDFHDALWTLTKQPAFPSILHPTPWVLLAPHISRLEVSSGPVHFIAVAAAVGIGFLARRWRSDWATIFWLASLACGIRCLFEPAMIPYYVMPTVALAFVVGAKRGRTRCFLTVAAGLGLIVMTYSHSNIWTYWFEMVGLMTAMLWCARPPAPGLNGGIINGTQLSMALADTFSHVAWSIPEEIGTRREDLALVSPHGQSPSIAEVLTGWNRASFETSDTDDAAIGGQGSGHER